MRIRLLPAVFFCGLFATVNSASAQIWTSNGTPIVYGCSSVTMSADGTKMAVAGDPSIYISTNSGDAWLPTIAPSQYWASIASSADGTKLIAAAAPGGTYLGGVYTSTNSGATWSSNNVPNPNYWNAVASSADGVRLTAMAGHYFSSSTGPIYISTDSGNTWTETSAPITNWCSIASSADGSKLLAGTFGGPVCLSTNSGATWMLQTNLPAARWTTMALSADGKILMAVTEQVGSGPGRIYASTNSGDVWTQVNAPTNQTYLAFCSSADGTKIVAISYHLFFYSTNSGNTWTSNSSPNLAAKWNSMASSADGNKLAVVDIGIYTTYSTPSPQLNLTASSNTLAFSWLVPSTNFVLQQNLDMSSGSWLTLTSTPVLNLTNLQNQVTLSPSNSSGFFRLSTQ